MKTGPVYKGMSIFDAAGPFTNNHSTMSKAQTTYPHQKVVIADDHAIFRHGLKTLLSTYSFLKLVGEASNGRELIELVETEKPDMVFTDLHMPSGHGLEAATLIHQNHPEIKLIILSFYNDALTVERLMKIGATAYLSKNISLELMDKMFLKIFDGEKYICPDAANNVVIHKVSSTPVGGIQKPANWFADEITNREKQVLKMVTEGMTYKEIGKRLNISHRTVESHKEKLFKKLGARNTAELIAIAHEFNLL